MIGLQYVSEHTSLPVPRIHAYDCTTIGYPYMVADYVHGIRLVDVWYEPFWRSEQRRVLTAIAGYMVELSQYEFDQIGCLDRVVGDGPFRVVPFRLPTPSGPMDEEEFEPSQPEFGPFTSTQTYLRALVEELDPNAIASHKVLVAILRMLLATLPDARYDGSPFTLSHCDFDSQNVLLNESGNIATFIDWDGFARPRQLGALSYPSWLIVDWDPIMYEGYKMQPNHDTPADLHAYRKMSRDAVDSISSDAL